MPALLSGTSVAKHSLKYWDENTDKWRKEFGNDIEFRTKGAWSFIAVADVAAAISTRITSSIALVVPFIGWGWYAGIVGGSTIVASGVTATLYYLIIEE